MKKEFIDIPDFEEPSGLEIRYTIPEDITPLTQWLKEPGVLRWFPMEEPKEIDDSIKRWIGFHKYQCSLTATLNGTPCGISTLWLQPYRKVSHQCQFGILVDNSYRGKNIGSSLLKNLIHLAKNYFKIELLHLEVYEGNPAYRLYKRFGFKEFGRQSHWIKQEGEYIARIFMERFI
jgi:RimJ/RimL family protein N-acetyltransferase